MHSTDRYHGTLKRAQQIASRTGHERVELQDLAVALTESRGVAASALARLCKLKHVRRRLLERFSLQLAGPGLWSRLFGRHTTAIAVPNTDAVREVLSQAPLEAKALNHNYVGTEHILLSLLPTSEDVTGCFRAEDVSYDEVREAIRRLLGQGD